MRTNLFLQLPFHTVPLEEPGEFPQVAPPSHRKCPRKVLTDIFPQKKHKPTPQTFTRTAAPPVGRPALLVSLAQSKPAAPRQAIPAKHSTTSWGHSDGSRRVTRTEIVSPRTRLPIQWLAQLRSGSGRGPSPASKRPHAARPAPYARRFRASVAKLSKKLRRTVRLK